ncbi:MAG: rhomboid family intramembrane serine protease [Phycisphaeraceae bacterium]|nr:rhomboid family intramembrane serine protease [Phycisphaeraceae bacterium]
MTQPPGTEDKQDAIPSLNESVVVRWLIGLCLILYAVNTFFTTAQIDLQTGQAVIDPKTGQPVLIGLLTAVGNFNVVQGINGFQFWRLFSYQFLHGNLLHLGMNMMALYVFGPLIEKWWGPKRFLAFYLLCGACGAWFMAMFAFNPALINGQNAWLVGASGSIFGVLVASAMLYPKDEVKLIIPPMWVTVRKLAIVFIALSVGAMFADVIFKWNLNFGGNAAHVGGAVFGYLLVKRPWSLDFVDKDAPSLQPPGGGSEGDEG